MEQEEVNAEITRAIHNLGAANHKLSLYAHLLPDHPEWNYSDKELHLEFLKLMAVADNLMNSLRAAKDSLELRLMVD